MSTGECLMYGLDLESRCLCTVTAEEERVQFLIGTHNIKLDNQICLLTVEGDYERVVARNFVHQIGEVRALVSSPERADTLATASADYRLTRPEHRVNIFRMSTDQKHLEDVTHKEYEAAILGLEWEAHSSCMAYIVGNKLRLAAAEASSIDEQFVFPLTGNVHSVRFSPHTDGNSVAVCVDKDVIAVDRRTNSVANRIPDAHMFRCLTADFNPNLPHCLATGGDEGAIRVWDWRKPDKPLYCIRPHSHWVWQVRYHAVHDQLLLSCSADACVTLNCMQCVSSEMQMPSLNVDDDEDNSAREQLGDGELDRLNEHEDSVCAVEWASADPWTYASLSHDGRVVVSRVNRQHKYTLMQL